jgi:D-arabinitol dehydrogenase (NADP+)
MQVIEYQCPGQLRQVEQPIPNIGEDDVLVKIAYSGICGTDLHIIAEEAPAAERVILGHEFSGTVTDIGSNVSNIKIGSTVAIDPNNYCGKCKYCMKDRVHFCENKQPIGISRNGGWAEYCVVPKRQVFTLPRNSDLSWGALSEPISCIIHGWDKVHPIENDESILILGAGIIGLLWRLVFNYYDVKNVVISEPNESRRKIVENLGYEAIDPAEIEKNHSGFDVIIDCSGNSNAIETSIKKLKPFGRFLFFGISPQNAEISIKPFDIFEKELTLFGSVINPKTFNRGMAVMNAIQIPLERLGVKFYSLVDYDLAIKDARSGKVTKAMFNLDTL